MEGVQPAKAAASIAASDEAGQARFVREVTGWEASTPSWGDASLPACTLPRYVPRAPPFFFFLRC